MIDKAHSEYTAQKSATIKPKDIAVADQASSVTQEEITNVEAVFRQISEIEKSSRGENPEHDWNKQKIYWSNGSIKSFRF